MAYLAIARKWRPQRFDDIVGQGHVTRTLKNAIELGRVHHAFLFTGARGVGKTTAARILAKALNCEQGPTASPCNVCKACHDITAGIASDVHEIDAASNTGVDSVREIRDNLRYLPSSGRHKIYIIDEVHMLSTQAFNALLKTLEEPPPHVVFIFATTDPQKVPDTILSRCQRFDFKRIPLKQISEKLGDIARNEGVHVSEASLLMIAREAEGSMRDAQSLLDQVISSSGTEVRDDEVVEILGLIDRRLIFECLAGILERTPERCLEVVERIYGFGFDLKQFARELLEVVRHLNVVKVSNQADRFVDVSGEELGLLHQLADSVSLEELSRHFAILLEGFDAIARSESPRLVLEMTLLRMAQVRPVQPLDQLLARLAALESSLRGVGTGEARASGAAAEGAPPAGRGIGGEPAGRGAGIGGGPAGAPRWSAGSMGTPSGGQSAGGAPAGGTPAGASGRPQFTPPGARTPPVGGDARGNAGRPSFSRPAPAPTDQGRTAGHGNFGGPPSAGDPEDEGDDDDHGAVEHEPVVRPAAGAAAPSVPVEVGVTASEPPRVGKWVEFVDFWIRQPDCRTRPIFLKDAVPVKEEEARIVLGLRKALLLGKAAQEAADPEVAALMAQFFGRPVRIECVQIAEDVVSGQSYLAWEDARERQRRAEIERGERANSRVKLATQVFGVDPRDVRVEFERPKAAPGGS